MASLTFPRAQHELERTKALPWISQESHEGGRTRARDKQQQQQQQQSVFRSNRQLSSFRPMAEELKHYINALAGPSER